MKPKVTLCMIVKNETHIIEQCLRSISKYVDRYDITDTGSTDGTQELIKKTMDELGVPGEVHQSDWKGFGDHAGKIGSRTEAFQNAAKSDATYAWVIDADDYMEGDFTFPEEMNADAYSLKIGRGDFTWWRNQIFKLSCDWHYRGILHEYAFSEGVQKESLKHHKIVGNYKIVARTEGARNVGITPIEKYMKDAETLEKAILDEPENDRYQFYLAQSYFDSQQWEKSLDAYQKRVDMGGWPEEVYYSKLRVALIKGIMDKPLEEISLAFLECFNSRPTRAEPLWFLSRMYRMKNMPAIGYIYAKIAAEIPYPQHDILFIQDDVYSWGILDEIGATAFHANQPHVGYAACKKILEENRAPVEHLERIKNNFESYKGILQQIHANQEAQRLAEKDLKKQKKINKEKKGTKLPERKGYKKRPKQKT